MLIEVSVAMSLAATLALMVMKASLLALSNNQWTIMQTLTDAYMTRETALAHRVPMAVLLGEDSPWPDAADSELSELEETVSLGRTAGSVNITGKLVRFRVDETPTDESNAGIAVWRLHSVLTYKVGEDQYYKSRATVRMQ